MAALRQLSLSDLTEFAGATMLDLTQRRQLAVHTRGSKEAKGSSQGTEACNPLEEASTAGTAVTAVASAAAGAAGAEAGAAAGAAAAVADGAVNRVAGALGEGDGTETADGVVPGAERPVGSIWEFKRAAELWPGARSWGFQLSTGAAGAASTTVPAAVAAAAVV